MLIVCSPLISSALPSNRLLTATRTFLALLILNIRRRKSEDSFLRVVIFESIEYTKGYACLNFFRLMLRHALTQQRIPHISVIIILIQVLFCIASSAASDHILHISG